MNLLIVLRSGLQEIAQGDLGVTRVPFDVPESAASDQEEGGVACRFGDTSHFFSTMVGRIEVPSNPVEYEQAIKDRKQLRSIADLIAQDASPPICLLDFRHSVAPCA